MEPCLFGRAVGSKFYSDGSVRHFPGNTIISLLEHPSPVLEKVNQLCEQLAALAAADCIALLPAESLHMTVIEGVCDQVRDAAHWTRLLPLDISLEQVDAFFQSAFSHVKPLGEVQMRFSHLRIDSGITIRLAPCADEDAQELKRFRDEVKQHLGLSFPDHDHYGFHISLGYGIVPPDESKATQLTQWNAKVDAQMAAQPFVFRVPKAQLVYFDNMFFFDPCRRAR